MLSCLLMLQEIWYLEYKMKKERSNKKILALAGILIGIIALGFVSTGDYKFQYKEKIYKLDNIYVTNGTKRLQIWNIKDFV